MVMTIWESGRESELLDDIIAGRKTIEGRLDKGKFADYRVDDIVRLRRDIRDENGELHDGEPNAAHVKIVAIRKYRNFLELVEQEGYKNVIPAAASAKAAADEYAKYYSSDDQEKYGVLAIEIAPLSSVESWNETYEKGGDFAQLSDADVAQLVGFLPSSVPRTAFDIGCGTGRLVRQLKQEGLDTIGVDLSEAAIVRALAEDPGGEYTAGDISAVSGTFGVITCKLVYAFIEDKEQFLYEVSERLDSKGFFVLLAPTHDRPINSKKGIHVDRLTILHQVRAQFRIIYRQQTKLGLLIVCCHRTR